MLEIIDSSKILTQHLPIIFKSWRKFTKIPIPIARFSAQVNNLKELEKNKENSNIPK